MSVQRFVASMGLVLLVAACVDSVAPRRSQQPAPQFVRWSPATQPRFAAVGDLSGGPVSTGGGTRLLLSNVQLSGIQLGQYTASFWAVRGQSRTVEIDYASADTTQPAQPFLRFTATDPAFVPGVGDLAVGDSVFITVTVDTTRIGVRFEPTGLQFATPADLQIWYSGAHGDLNGDGVVDSLDTAIARQWLGVWYQEGAGSPWTQIPATPSPVDQSFIVSLPHFSDYDIAFDEYAVSW